MGTVGPVGRLATGFFGCAQLFPFFAKGGWYVVTPSYVATLPGSYEPVDFANRFGIKNGHGRFLGINLTGTLANLCAVDATHSNVTHHRPILGRVFDHKHFQQFFTNKAVKGVEN